MIHILMQYFRDESASKNADTIVRLLNEKRHELSAGGTPRLVQWEAKRIDASNNVLQSTWQIA